MDAKIVWKWHKVQMDLCEPRLHSQSVLLAKSKEMNTKALLGGEPSKSV